MHEVRTQILHKLEDSPRSVQCVTSGVFYADYSRRCMTVCILDSLSNLPFINAETIEHLKTELSLYLANCADTNN